MSEEDELQEGNQEERGGPQGEEGVEDWLAAERSRLDRGFQFEPKPTTSESASSGSIETALAGVGLGAGVVAGAAAPHPNPTTFQGVKPTVIINALREELGVVAPAECVQRTVCDAVAVE